MTTEPNRTWPREGYRPEWLAVSLKIYQSIPSYLHIDVTQLEDASGGRYVMTGNFAVDVPTYDAVFAAMSKGWPELPEEMKVCK